RTARAVQAAVDRQRHPDDRAAGDSLLDLAVLQGRRLPGLLLREPRDPVRADRGGRAHPGPRAGPGGAAPTRLALQGRGRARGRRAHRLLLPRGDRGDPSRGPAGRAAHRRVELSVLRRVRVLLPGSVLAAARAARALHLGSGPHATVSRNGTVAAAASGRMEPMASENLTRDEARSRASFLSTDSYDIRLDLTTDERTFRTETTLRFSSTEARPTFVDLIAQSVEEIELNGELLTDPASRFDGARVQLPELAEGANTLRILATARYMNTGEGLHRFVDPVDDEVYLYTQFEVSDARRMFACFEQPDLKATYALTVTAPAHWRVISNAPTPTPSAASDGIATWAFEPTERISTYLVALIAGNYQGGTGEITTRDGRTIPMGVFARASLAEHVDARAVIDVTKAGIDFYEEAFDQDFPFRKYDQVF